MPKVGKGGGGVRKKDEKRERPIEEGWHWKGGLKPSANYDAYFVTFYKPSYGISCLSKNVAIIIIVSLCSCSNSLSISWLNTSITSFLSLEADKSSNWERSLFLKTSVICSCFQSYTKLGQVCVIPFCQIWQLESLYFVRWSSEGFFYECNYRISSNKRPQSLLNFETVTCGTY